MWEEHPKPLEETDPELAEFIIDICNNRVPYRIDFSAGEIYDTRTGGIAGAEKKVGRNDPCPECLENGILVKSKKCKIH